MRPFDYALAHPTYFATSRRSVCGGLWIGLFFGLLPIPGQTALAIVVALLARVNVPVAAITVWISNPLTFVPIFYFAYRIGTILLDMPTEPMPVEFTMDWLSAELAMRAKPLFYGSFIIAVSVASTAYLALTAIWHISTLHRYRSRHTRSVGAIRGGKKRDSDTGRA